jgi:putative restriction endonuclease
MRYLLSVKTVFPARGRKVWYDDQREVHEQINRGSELVDYAFMGDDPQAADNRWLREARDEQIPILYFPGVAPQRWMAIWPTYIAEWSAIELKARLAFGVPAQVNIDADFPTVPERRYGLRMVRQRLHQSTFREAVLTAYEGRCALTGLPEPRLLDAAHIVPDIDTKFGQPVVTNGLPLSKLHHAAFDANLIGIGPDYRIHISEALLSMNDGRCSSRVSRLWRVGSFGSLSGMPIALTGIALPCASPASADSRPAERADVDGVILSLRFDADGADGDRPKAVIG